VRIDELDGHALCGLEKIITGVRPDQLDAATPCTQWTVRDLLAHIVAVNRKYTGIARGDPWVQGSPLLIWEMTRHGPTTTRSSDAT
jgi:uncharacterized protein (TIGR03083 family)